MVSGAPVNVLDYGADATGAADSTAAFTSALAAGNTVFVPTGTFSINNVLVASGQRIVGNGISATTLVQRNAANPALNFTSATAGFIGGGLINVQIIGATAATAELVRISATAPSVIHNCDFDFRAVNCYSACIMTNTTTAEIYGNRFKIEVQNCTYQAVVSTGVYNTYDFFIVGTPAGVLSFVDTSLNSTFIRAVTDGQQFYGGRFCTALSPTVEGGAGTLAQAYTFGGYYNTIINPCITSSTCTNGFALTQPNYVIDPQTYGSTITYPILFNAATANTSTFIGGNIPCTYKIEQYIGAQAMAQLTLVGDCSSYSKQTTPSYKIPYTTVTTTTYTVDASIATNGLDTVIRCSNAGAITLTLPTGAYYVGRIIRIWNVGSTAIGSASSNVNSLTNVLGSTILAGTPGKWIDLQYDGTYWDAIAGN
jgi:hypothetical protein